MKTPTTGQAELASQLLGEVLEDAADPAAVTERLRAELDTGWLFLVLLAAILLDGDVDSEERLEESFGALRQALETMQVAS